MSDEDKISSENPTTCWRYCYENDSHEHVYRCQDCGRGSWESDDDPMAEGCDVCEALPVELLHLPEQSDVYCTDDDYKAACEALVFGQNVHAEARKRWNNEGYRALLTPSEFHDRALELARNIAGNRKTNIVE